MAEIINKSFGHGYGNPTGIFPIIKPGVSDSPTPGVGVPGNMVSKRSKLWRASQ